MKNKEYSYICGKVFNNSQSINAHKSRCRQWFMHIDGNLDRYNEIIKRQMVTLSKIFEEKRNERQKTAEELWLKEKHYCEHCGKLMTEYYGSGRFCSRSCANARAHSKETKKKISESAKKNGYTNAAYNERKHEEFLNSSVKTSTGYLDITNKELQEYRKKITACEICGKIETTMNRNGKIQNLAADHNHLTNRFRGLLCSHCNRNLGWFEENLFGILDYIKKDIDR